MSEKRMFCVRLPTRGSSIQAYESVEDKVNGTLASSGKQAVTHVLAKADKKRIGPMATELADRHGSLEKVASKFTVDAEFLEDYIGVHKVKDRTTVKVLPYTNDSEMTEELAKRLGGKSADYERFMDQYNLHYSHREIN